MAIRGTDFTLSPDKLDREYMLVEVNDWLDYNTKEKLGYHYIVLLPKLQYEKVRVSVRSNYPIATKDDLAAQGQMPVTFEGLRTWASVYNGRLSVKAEAMEARIVERPKITPTKPPEVK